MATASLRRALVRIPALWTLFGLFFSLQAYLARAYLGGGLPLGTALLRWLLCAYAWAILTPLVMWLSRHFPIGTSRPWRALGVHVPAAFAFSLASIRLIEAADNYVQLHVGGETHLVHGTLGKLEASLDPARFLRVHRSAIVNLTRIRTLEPLFHGEYRIVIDSGDEVTSGRTYRDRLERLVTNSF